MWAVITKYHQLGGLLTTGLISYTSRGWKSETREPAWLGAIDSSLLGCSLLASPFILVWQNKGEGDFWGPFGKDTL
jgi:hypothetical protein